MMRPAQHRFGAAAAVMVVLAAAPDAHAQMFHLYLQCQGEVKAGRSVAKADLDLALRDNNMTAFVQRSNVLPSGERMKYMASQSHYTMTYTPLTSSRVYIDWRGSWLFTWYPAFQQMRAARFSVDRQTGVLEGEFIGPAGESLGALDMQCEPKKEGEGPAPRF